MRSALFSLSFSVLLVASPAALAKLGDLSDAGPCSTPVGGTLDDRNLRNIQVAELGFHASPELLPPALRARWDSVIRFDGFDCARQTLGSMVLIRRDAEYAYFLSVDHLFRNQPGGVAACLQRAQLRTTKFNAGLSFPMERVDSPPAGTKISDLALIRVKLEGANARVLREMSVVQIPARCREPSVWEKNVRAPRYFEIGYPAIYDREENLGVLDAYDRRWSTGVALAGAPYGFKERAEKEGYETRDYRYSEVDTLQGNSGSPQFWEDGSFAGIVSLASGGSAKKQVTTKVGAVDFTREINVPAPGEKIVNAYVGCERVVEFLQGTAADPTK